MTTPSKTCPKCNASMEPGFIVDFGYGRTEPSHWVEGEPEPGFLSGAKVRGKRRLPVSSFRCRACGYLESFAGAPTVAATTDCMECGASLSEDARSCAACGWAYATDSV